MLVRQVLGAIAQFEKATTVAKLRAARQRKREAVGKVEGRKSWAELSPELVATAKRLRRRSPKGHQRSLREVADELARWGFTNERGARFQHRRLLPWSLAKRALCLSKIEGVTYGALVRFQPDGGPV